MSNHNPYICFFPALQLAANLTLGDWDIGSPDSTVTWRAEPFGRLARALINSITTDGFKHPAILWHRVGGLDGKRPDDNEYTAIQAAVRFAVLDVNDHVHGDPNAVLYLATTENAVLYLQPLDEQSELMVHREGGFLRRILTFGSKVGDQPMPLPDAVVPLDRPVRASQKLASAIYEAGLVDSQSNRKIRIALEWHAMAMSNPNAVTVQQRLIALKTGFEALLGTSDSREGARRLRTLFERVTSGHRSLLPWAGVLWSPRERTDLPRTFKKKPELWSELEDWFMTLASARNEVIHEGKLTITEYKAPVERPLSRYAGLLFWIGERLLRETIKAMLGVDVLLCGALADQAEIDAIIAKHQVSIDADDAASGATQLPSATPAEVVRALDQLLALLGAKAANEVILKKVVAGSSASLAAAEKMELAARGKWEAKLGGKSMLINSSEKMLLEQAGAEEQLRLNFRRCE